MSLSTDGGARARPPVRIVAPTGPVVSVAELREQLRYETEDNDATLIALEKHVVSTLDGWNGLLKRAILPQTWRQVFAAGGEVRLKLPDVTAVRLFLVEGAVVTPFAEPVWDLDEAGGVVELPGLDGYQPGARWRVDYDCALPEDKLPTAQLLVKLNVGALDLVREGVVVGTLPPGEMPGGASGLISQLRWGGY